MFYGYHVVGGGVATPLLAVEEEPRPIAQAEGVLGPQPIKPTLVPLDGALNLSAHGGDGFHKQILQIVN